MLQPALLIVAFAVFRNWWIYRNFQEVLPCDENNPSSSVIPSMPSDYDVIDPYETDRREAMRQLYPDEIATYTISKSMPNFRKIPKNDEHGFRLQRTQIFSESDELKISLIDVVRNESAQELFRFGVCHYNRLAV
uniref:Astacin domain-containing protein n=1 Tax=Angiostrongylus cantonensis TaxID=6313 RepID=A0A0K0CYD4_ANGCA